MVQPVSPPPPPGWYADPNGQQRWWDGTTWGQLASTVPAPAPAMTSDPKSMAMLAQLLGIFTWIGPLVIYLIYAERDPFVRHHSSESLNFQITKFVALLCCIPLMFLLIGFLLFPVVIIGGLVLEIMATVAANRGEWYRYPINIRLVRGAISP